MSVPEQVPLPREKPAINPWLLVFGTGLGFVVLVVAGLSLLMLFAPKQPLRANERLMPDGTVLRIEGVTWGSIHKLNFEYSTSASWAFWDRLTMPLSHNVGQDELRIWMSRHDARSGRMLDFDWWAESTVVDTLGEEISDQIPVHCQMGRRGTGTSSSAEDRPFRADRSSHDAWVVSSSFRAFRTNQGRFKLRVKNISGEVVATFDLTHPSPPPVRSWQPEVLPVTKSNGDVAVTLKRLKPSFHWSTYNGVKQKWWYFTPETTMTENGAPANDWSNGLLELSDPLGNRWDSSHQQLSMREPAWRLKLGAYRLPQSNFLAPETWTISHVPLPAKDMATPLTNSHTIDGVNVTLIAMAAAGKTNYAITTPGIRKYGNSMSWSSSSSVFETETKHELKGAGSTITQTVEASWPHVSFEATDLTPLHRVYVKAKDDQDRSVTAQENFNGYGIQNYFFKTEPDAKSLTLSIIVHRGREFEFFVKPPELTEDTPMP